MMKVKFLKIVDHQNGVAQNGKEWTRIQFLVEEERYNKTYTLALKSWGETAEKILKLKENTSMEVGLIIESREYNGKWYSDPMVIGIANVGVGDTPSATYSATPVTPADDSDLPF